jgi:RHS repeat-associated protein
VRRALLLLALLVLPRNVAAQAETVEYYGQDMVGSIRIVWDVNGNVVGRKDYTPFGKPLFSAPSMPKEGFGAQEKDDETDQQYFHARNLAVRSGRFSSPDPVQNGFHSPQAWNRYAYALNNPTGFVDPTGNNAEAVFELDAALCGDRGYKQEFSDFCMKVWWSAAWTPTANGGGGWEDAGGGGSSPYVPGGEDEGTPDGDDGGNPPGCAGLGLGAAAADCSPPEEPPPGPPDQDCTPKTFFARLKPDYTRWSLNVSFLGVAGVAIVITQDRFGNSYFGVGPQMGRGFPVSVNYTGGYIWGNRTQANTVSTLSKGSFTAAAGLGVGGALSSNYPSKGNSHELGLFFPAQFGASWTYSWAQRGKSGCS